MTTNDIPSDEYATRRAFYEEMDDVVSGRRELTWSVWAAPINWATSLTDAGRGASLWAVGVLRDALGDDFLMRLRASGEEHPILSPALLVTLWPMAVDSRRLYEDLLRLAAQLDLARRYSLQWFAFRKILRSNLQDISWTHSLLQLHVFGLAYKDGWRGTFEPRLPTGSPGDLLLEHADGSRLLVEFTSMGMSTKERAAETYFQQCGHRMLAIEFEHNVHIRGSLGTVMPENEAVDWIRRIEQAAVATAKDGRERHILGRTPIANAEDAAASQDYGETLMSNMLDAPAEVWVTRELAVEVGGTTLSSGVVTGEPWPRLEARISDKARSTHSAGLPTVLHIEDESGFWLFTRLARMTLAERLKELTPRLRLSIKPYPHIVGVVLSPGVMWDTEAASGEAVNNRGKAVALAIRRPVAMSRSRETIIVTRYGQNDATTTALTGWYRHEDNWLSWALPELGQPPLEMLFR